MARLFDHLGFDLLGEWSFVGEYRPEGFREFNVSGRLGDIRDRPNREDLKTAAALVKGALRM